MFNEIRKRPSEIEDAILYYTNEVFRSLLGANTCNIEFDIILEFWKVEDTLEM